MTGTEATVLLPTTGERWELVELSLDCIRRQSVGDIQIFLVGDGVGATSRAKYEEWARQDPRLRFFDFPKHERRGEPHRHDLLTHEATGRLVAYCCDRDLWFPHHLEALREALKAADFAHTLAMEVQPEGSIGLTFGDLARPRHRRGVRRLWGYRLSNVGHSLAAYRRLPEGWGVTPEGQYTDRHMWLKFLDRPDVRAVTVPRPTLLYFNRGAHPGWPVAERRDELRRWHPRTLDGDGYAYCLEALVSTLHQEVTDLRDASPRAWDVASEPPAWLANLRGAPIVRQLGQAVRWLEGRGGGSAAMAARLRRLVRARR